MTVKKPFDESHIHEGHRARLLDTVLNAGIENVSEVQAMEFILFYIFPRGDVNPLAHRLLNEFGSVANVLDAGVNSLKEVDGIGDRSAKALTMLGELFFYYTQNKLSRNVQLSTYTEICDYFDELLRFMTLENLTIVALDASYMLTGIKMLSIGSVKNVIVEPTKVANFVISTKAVSVIFAHNHPGGAANPSTRDIEMDSDLKILVEKLGVRYIDHIIVGNNGLFSIHKQDYLRIFD